MFLDENTDLGDLRDVFIITILGTCNNLICFLLFLLGSIRKGIVEVSHVYQKLIYKLNVVKVTVTKPCVKYWSNLEFFVFLL